MNAVLKFAVYGIVTAMGLSGTAIGEDLKFQAWAPTPPMGWNSWDAFATTITEEQARAEVDAMAEHLASHGWQYFVVDHQWFEPGATGFDYRKRPKLVMDGYGRLQPAPNRFPSAVDGSGFTALAQYVHSRGLKFGIHIMRGIPRQAVEADTPILGTSYHASDIADLKSTCSWNDDMYGVDMSKPAAQEFYNGRIQQYADWGVDFLKVDDLSRPYHAAEIESIRKAIDLTGRPIVFSTSPGETPVNEADHILTHANMWRISDDFWDNWKSLLHQVQLTERWASSMNKGGWPDADMLPLGMIRQGKGPTRFTPDEQKTLMTLWCIARSPLIFGGDMVKMDPATLALITNDEVLDVNQKSSNNRPLFDRDGFMAWAADVPQSKAKYLAVFNLRDKSGDGSGCEVPVSLEELGMAGSVRVRDLWSHADGTTASGTFAPVIPWHGAGLYRLSP